jgi:iron-sulfur cluster assembly accessory protein
VVVNGRSTLRSGRGFAYTGEVVTLTGDARDKLRSLLADEGDPAAGLRVQVIPGGCSGFEYELALAGPQEGDEVVDDEGVRVIVDRFSVPYLLGVELDYEEGFQGAGFLIRNPNATSSCGCGKSFQA